MPAEFFENDSKEVVEPAPEPAPASAAPSAASASESELDESEAPSEVGSPSAERIEPSKVPQPTVAVC